MSLQRWCLVAAMLAAAPVAGEPEKPPGAQRPTWLEGGKTRDAGHRTAAGEGRSNERQRSRSRAGAAAKTATGSGARKAGGSAGTTERKQADAAARQKAPLPPPEILFTFDDGPHLERTPKVLDILARYGIHAVFFVNGVHFQDNSRASEKARALLRDVVARGHTIGNHTIHHHFLCGKVFAKRADEEIEGNAKLIERAIGRRPELYRTPYGSRCASLDAVLGRLGVKHTGWDIDPQDWKVQNTAKVRDFVIGYLKKHRHGREILLLHDIHQCTVEALPQILEWLVGENAARRQRGEAPIRVVDHSYLVPPRPAVPPIVDGLGRILMDILRMPDAAPLLALVGGRAPRS